MCCFFDSKTRKHEFLNATTDRNYLETIFKKHKIDLVVMEACGPSGWINDLAQSLSFKTLQRRVSEERVAKRAAAEQAAQTPKSTLQPTKSTPKRSPVRSSAAGPAKRKPTTTTTKGKPTKTEAKPTANPRRIRKLETAG